MTFTEPVEVNIGIAVNRLCPLIVINQKVQASAESKAACKTEQDVHGNGDTPSIGTIGRHTF